MTPEQIIAEAGAAFDAWRERCDPNHNMPIELATAAYCRAIFGDPRQRVSVPTE